jgi:hypothetical protein
MDCYSEKKFQEGSSEMEERKAWRGLKIVYEQKERRSRGFSLLSVRLVVVDDTGRLFAERRERVRPLRQKRRDAGGGDSRLSRVP